MSTRARIDEVFDHPAGDNYQRRGTAFRNSSRAPGGPEYRQYYYGREDPYIEGYEKHVDGWHEGGPGVHVYEFPTDQLQDEFLDRIGGSPHPLGGRRVIIT